jgi:adenylylsulfate kinase
VRLENIVENVVWHQSEITREQRELQNGHRSCVLWFTGLSGSGKSTLAHSLEEQLHKMGCRTFVLDGDNVRHGLSSNLGFSEIDRKENIRRIGEVAKLMFDAGIIVMAAFISPYRDERNQVRNLMPVGSFFEIFCNASLEICEGRDVKGFYKKARAGEIKNYTGIDSPYETPLNPDLILDTERISLKVCTAEMVQFLFEQGVIRFADH